MARTSAGTLARGRRTPPSPPARTAHRAWGIQRSARLLATTLGFALLVAGCGPPSPPPDAGDARAGGCGAGPGSIEVGVGGSRLSPLSDGDPLPIVRGAQGGIHVVVGAWVRDMALDRVEMRYWLEDPGGTRIGLETALVLDPSLFSPATGGAYQRHPDLVVLNDEMANVDDFAGAEAVLRVEARASDGTHACDARTVVLAPPDT